MNFDNTEQIEALAKLPPEPPKPAERSIWSLVPRAVAGGAAKVGAAAVDALDTVGDSAGKRKAFERQGLRAPETDLSTIATSARDFERDMRPDPVTAGTAEQLVYGAVSGLTAAGLGAVLGGAPGAAIGMGGAEGAATADDLRRQGVDPKTARAAGLVVGGVGAASVALPIAGQTLKATAGLYLAGGPAGFMAQQEAVSQILSSAGYAKIAEQYDPLDPVGLAVSALVPLPFAGYGAMRNVRAARAARAAEVPPVREPVPGEPVKPAEPPKPVEPAPVPRAPETAPEVVDAAMVHNLTLQRQAQEAVPLDSRVREAQFIEATQRDANLRALMQDSKLVDEEGRPMILYHGTGDDFDAFDLSAPSYTGNDGWYGKGINLTINPNKASGYATHVVDGFEVPRPGGNVMPVYASIRNPLVIDGLTYRDIAKWPEWTSQERRAIIEDGGVLTGQVSGARITELAIARGYDGVIGGYGSEVVVFDPKKVKSAIGNSGRYDPTSGSLTDPLPAPKVEPAAQPLRPLETTIEALAQSTDPATRTLAEGLRLAAKDIERLQVALPAGDSGSFVQSLEAAAKEVDGARKAGQTLADYLRARDGGDMPAAVNNLMIGLAEAARSPKRVAALVRQLADAADAARAAAEPQTAGDVTANAVERMRTLTDEQLAGSDVPAPKAGADALVQSVNDRMAALEVAAPDMVVRLDADGNPITLRDELARIRREAAEGTDSTLGGDDAPLVQVAATCALSMGA